MSAQPIVTAMAIEFASDDPSERLATLFDAHQDRLYRLARRLAPTADEARDLVQDTFLKAARSLKSVPVGLAAEEAWLVRVLVNIRRDQWRKAAVRNRYDASLDVEPALQVSNQESVLIARATVWRALDTLPPRRRAVVVLHELEGLAISAIASLLGITAITTRWHLSMGRRDLTRVLKAHIEERA